jgi:hypothetical protein
MKEEQGKLPWSKPTLVAVPGENYDRTSLRAFDPQTARQPSGFVGSPMSRGSEWQ